MDTVFTQALGGGIFAATNSLHTFGTDAILLADFASPKTNENMCDLCSGCGIIPLLTLRKPHRGRVCAVELQPDACELIKQGEDFSGFDGRIEVVNADLRQIKEHIPANSFNLVTINPPYFVVGSGKECGTHEQQLIRSEVCCTPRDFALAAAWLLKSGGRLCLCHRPERLADVFSALREAKIEPKRLRFVAKSPESAPWLFLLEGRLDGKPSLSVEPTLFMDNERELERIYGTYTECKTVKEQ